MWVKELANGKFKFTERYQFDSMPTPKYVSCTLKSKSAQAEKKALKILMKKIDDKKNAKSKKDKMTVSELFDKWLKLREKSIKKLSLKDYKHRAKMMLDQIGYIDVNKLRAG